MTDRTALTRLAKSVAADMTSGRMSDGLVRSVHALEAEPKHVFDLVDLLAKEGKKKKPNDELIAGYAFLVAHGLEQLRYGVERADASPAPGWRHRPALRGVCHHRTKRAHRHLPISSGRTLQFQACLSSRLRSVVSGLARRQTAAAP